MSDRDAFFCVRKLGLFGLASTLSHSAGQRCSADAIESAIASVCALGTADRRAKRQPGAAWLIFKADPDTKNPAPRPSWCHFGSVWI